MKTRQDNDVTDRIGVVYTENDIELPWSIGSSAGQLDKTMMWPIV